MSDNVYVALGLTNYEASTVMAVFDSPEAARSYLEQYQRHVGTRSGADYRATYDDYEVLPVELNAMPFRYSDLAAIRPLGL